MNSTVSTSEDLTPSTNSHILRSQVMATTLIDAVGSKPITNAAVAGTAISSERKQRRRPWTAEEIEQLNKGVIKYKNNWTKIALEFVKTRNAKQCRHCYTRPNPPAGLIVIDGCTSRWSPRDKDLLNEGLKKYGVGKWKEIQQDFCKNKSVFQISKRAHKLSD